MGQHYLGRRIGCCDPKMLSHLALLALGSAFFVQADTHLERNNLAYRSPYINHDSLAINTGAIVLRHEDHADVLRRKRQLPPQVVAPKDLPNTYTHSGY